MGREVPFDKDATCQDCGAKGAYDFMGDHICGNCMGPPAPEGELKLPPEQFRAEMEKILLKHGDDLEECHVRMDALAYNALINLGYEAGAEIWNNTDKWYA